VNRTPAGFCGDASDTRRVTTDAPSFLHLLEPRDGVILLACAAPDAPPAELVDAYARILPELAATVGDIGYYPMGHPKLRRAIADRFGLRGVPTTPGQILVTTGGQQALSLLARSLVRPGDRVLVEAPTYPGALETFREEAAVLRTLPVGLPGLTAAAAAHSPAFAYVISTYQNPTGAVLPTLPRRRLVEDAAAAGIVLVDDEVPAELGFPGEQPPPPLAAFDDQVITIGSLSKVVWGGLRIGWVRAPEPVIARLSRLRAVHDLGGNVPAQLAAADLLPRLDALRDKGAVRRQAGHDHLRAELARHLPDWPVPAVRGGQTFWVRLPHGDGASFTQAALRHGVAVLPGPGLDGDGRSEEYIRLHFVAAQEELTEAVRRLASAWQDYRAPKGRVTSPPAMAV
jgi:DNA-binding transcriptional MocR family regulator